MKKLIRDNIPTLIVQSGKTPRVSVLDDHGFQKALRTKLLEETFEFLEDDTLEELGDVLEVLRFLITNHRDFDGWNEFENMIKQKNSINGSFNKRLFLEGII